VKSSVGEVIVGEVSVGEVIVGEVSVGEVIATHLINICLELIFKYNLD
jgi:hypothetical protein